MNRLVPQDKTSVLQIVGYKAGGGSLGVAVGIGGRWQVSGVCFFVIPATIRMHSEI